MNNSNAIEVKAVSKSFKLPHEKNGSIKGALINFRKRKKGYETQKVLKNISFDVKKGEFFGIVGRNGSGKSTLLKLLAGIYATDEGLLQVNGKLTPFIELGVGFNHELTGRENVFLNGALLGFNRKEMDAMYDDIVKFAELERFMDQKLKNYSSGMQVRLAFSIAIRAETEILLIDEVLAVGDVAFQKKCYAVFQSLKRAGRTVVFVTHSMGDVERFCDRVLVVDKGKQIGIFEAHEARVRYEKINQEEIDQSEGAPKEVDARWGVGPVKVESIKLTSNKKPLKKYMKPNAPLEIHLDFNLIKKPEAYERSFVIGMNIFSEDGHNLFGPNTTQQHVPIETKAASLVIPSLPLNQGKYYLTVALFDEKLIETYDQLDRTVTFSVEADEGYYGSLSIEHEWIIKK